MELRSYQKRIVHRAKRIVERRRGSNQLRIGTAAVAVVQAV